MRKKAINNEPASKPDGRALFVGNQSGARRRPQSARNAACRAGQRPCHAHRPRAEDRPHAGGDRQYHQPAAQEPVDSECRALARRARPTRVEVRDQSRQLVLDRTECRSRSCDARGPGFCRQDSGACVARDSFREARGRAHLLPALDRAVAREGRHRARPAGRGRRRVSRRHHARASAGPAGRLCGMGLGAHR